MTYPQKKRDAFETQQACIWTTQVFQERNSKVLGACKTKAYEMKSNESVGTRTQDLRLKRPLLYRLSYTPASKRHTVHVSGKPCKEI